MSTDLIIILYSFHRAINYNDKLIDIIMAQVKMKKLTLWQTFKNEFRFENFNLNFELNSQFQQLEPEKVLQYYHSIF